MSDSKEKKKEVKDSNELLNIFLIIIGGLFIFQGVLYYIGVYFSSVSLPIPDWILVNLGGSGSGTGTLAFQGLLGDSALVRLVMGAWAFISGIGMFKEQEWAWGQALVVLSMILVTTGGAIITAFVNGTALTAAQWTNWAWYIQFISVVFSALGILWLLGTKERYH